MRSLVLGDEGYSLEKPFAGNQRGIRYYCQTCGEIWGRLELNSNGVYICANQPCSEHGTRHNRGGSILKPLIWWDIFSGGNLEKCLEYLPYSVLRYEALRASEQILKG